MVQINRAVEQMNQLTQHTAANSEESAAAAQQFSSQAEDLRSLVTGFSLTELSAAGSELSSFPAETRFALPAAHPNTPDEQSIVEGSRKDGDGH
ncbi:MAG: hypothetical protein V3T83_22465 [Acidobacteriota bacterium]